MERSKEAAGGTARIKETREGDGGGGQEQGLVPPPTTGLRTAASYMLMFYRIIDG